MEYKQVYVLSKKYTDGSISGITGTLAGKNCTISSTSHDATEGATTVNFKWTADDGTVNTSSIKVYDGETPSITTSPITGGNQVTFTTSHGSKSINVMDGADGNDGVSITNVTVNASHRLIVTFSDGTSIDAGSVGSDVAMSALTDVTLSALTDGDMLKYDATSGMWVNEALSIAVNLQDLNNVKLTAVTNGDVLQYNSVTGKWVNGKVKNIETINDIDDVTVTSPSVDQVLVYDGSKWINQDNQAVGNISDLTDVDISSPTNGQILIYDTTTGMWKNGSPSATSTAIKDLSDVNIVNISDNQILKWNATNQVWVNATSGETIDKLSDIGDVDVAGLTDGQIICWDASRSRWINGDIATNLSELGDVTFISLTSGQILAWNGTKWVNVDKRVSNMDDVTLATLTNGQILAWNGSKWTNINRSMSTQKDVSVASLASGQILAWNGSAWINVDKKVSNMDDVTLTALTSGQLLVWDGTKWVNVDNKITDLNDVNLTSLSNGQILKWDGTHWINVDLSNPTQYSTMPAASDSPQAIVQYTGTTNSSYTKGFFYYSAPKVVSGELSYSWEQIDTQENATDYENLSNLPSIGGVELIGDKSLDDLSIQSRIQYTTMPSATVDNLGQIVEYVGATTADYKLGYFYQCQYVNSAYTWVKVDVSDNSSLTERVTTLETNQGDISTLEVTGVSDLVAAINALNNKKLSTITYSEPILTLTYQDNTTITFNVRDSILSETQIGELANVTDTSISNGNILQYDSSILGYKPYDISATLSNLLQSSKDYTDLQIASIVTDDAFVCDTKPTCAYDSSTASYIVVYYQNSVIHTTSETTARFYYKVDSNPYCTSWFVTGDPLQDPVEYTYLLSAPDFDDYVSKSKDVVSTYTEDMADKTKIPNIASMDALLAVVKTLLSAKVNTADIVDNLLSTSATVPLSANQGKILKDTVDAKQDIIQMDTMPVASTDYVGKIYQYVGTTSVAYKQGSFYVGTYDADTDVYSWKEIEFAPDMEEITAAEVDALWT